jgi:predicted amidohydrolase YtcJ
MRKIIRSRHIFTEEGLLNGYLVISDGIIEKVSRGEPDEEEMRGVEYLSFEKGMVLPGLVDTHCFFMGKYFQEYGEDFSRFGAEDLRLDFMNRTGEKLVIGRNVREEAFRELFSKSLPNKYPIVLFHESYEEMLVNEEAERCYMVHTGSVTMEGCVNLIEEAMKDQEAFLKAYENHGKKLLSRGVTSVKEVIFDHGFGYLEAMEKLRVKKGLPIRTTVVSQPVAKPWNISWGAEMKEKYHHRDLRFYGFNAMLDGSMSQEEAHLKKNYMGKEYSVRTMPDYEKAHNLVKEADEKNLVVSLHAQGGKAVEEAVRIFSCMKKDEGGNLLNRHSMTDLEMGELEEFRKIAKLGLHAEIYPQIQSIYADWNGKIHQVKGHVGEEYHKIWNRAALVSEGVSISCATDLPLLFPDLPESIYHGCGAFLGASEEPFVEENAMDRVSLIKAWTRGGIENLYGSEDKLGRLKEGYIADLVIFDRNLLEESLDTIRYAEVLLTISRGETAFKKILD